MAPKQIHPARFPIVDVDEDDLTIADLQSKKKIVVPHQRGFYSLARVEPKISAKKDILIERNSDKALFYGDDARDLLDLHGDKSRVRPTDFPDYTVFVQSTSYNRKLQKGWRLAYEVPSEPMYLDGNDDNDDDGGGGGSMDVEDEEEAEEEDSKPPARKTRASKRATPSPKKAPARKSRKTNKEEEEKPDGGKPLDGMVFCVTGALSVVRKEFVNYLSENGGEVRSSVTKEVTHLVSADPTTAKAEKAREKGVTVLSEDDVRALVDDGGKPDAKDQKEEEEEEEPKSPRRGRPRKASGSGSPKKKDNEPKDKPAKPTRVKRKVAAKKESSDEEEDEKAAEEPPAKKPTRAKRKAAAKKESSDEEEDEEAAEEPPAKKPKRTPKAKATKKTSSKTASARKAKGGEDEWIAQHLTFFPIGYASSYQGKSDPMGVKEGVVAAAREAFRAVMEDDTELWNAVLADTKHIVDPAMRPWSVNCSWTPLDKAIEMDNMPIVKLVLDAVENPQPDRVQPPIAESLRVDGGSMSVRTFGFRPSSNVGVSRGGKEGNSALLADQHFGQGHHDSYSILRNIDAATIKSTKMVDYLRVLNDSVVDGWGEMGFYRLCESGNYVAAGRVAEILLENDGYGLNHVHVSALTIKGPKGGFKKFTKPQVCKKAMVNEAITPVHCAAINARTTKPLEDLLDANPAAANKVTDKAGRTPMHFAAAAETPAAIKLLTKRGFDIAALDRKGITPLALAARFGRYQNIPLLLPKKTKKGETIKDFLDTAPRYWKTPLVEAATKGHARAVEELLELGAGIDVPDRQDKKQAIHWAAQQGHAEVVKVLLGRGAEVDAADKKKRTPLLLAAANGHAHIVDLLLEHGANVADHDSSKNTVLHYAAAYGWYIVCQKLLKKDADANAENDWKIKPHVVATLKGHTAIAKLLVEQPNVSVDDRDSQGRTLLSLTLDSRDDTTLEQVRFLVVDKKANVSLPDLNGATPLHYFAAGKAHDQDAAIVDILVEAGGDLGAKTEGGTRPLMTALEHKNVPLIQGMVNSHVTKKIGIDGQDEAMQNVFHKLAHLIAVTPVIVSLAKDMCKLPGAADLLTQPDVNGFGPIHLLLKIAMSNSKTRYFNSRLLDKQNGQGNRDKESDSGDFGDEDDEISDDIGESMEGEEDENMDTEEEMDDSEPGLSGKVEPCSSDHLVEVVSEFFNVGSEDVVTSVVQPWSEKSENEAKKKAHERLSWDKQQQTTWEEMGVKQPYLGWSVLHLSTSLLLPRLVKLCVDAGSDVNGTGADGMTALQHAFQSIDRSRKGKSRRPAKRAKMGQAYPPTIPPPISPVLPFPPVPPGHVLPSLPAMPAQPSAPAFPSTNAQPAAEQTQEEEAAELEDRRRSDLEMIIRDLVKGGAEVNAKDKDGLTCVSYALRNYVNDDKHDSAMLKLLLQQDADISIADHKRGFTALHAFLDNTKKIPLESGMEVLRLLLQAKGCDVRLGDKKGNSSVHHAVRSCQSETALSFSALGLLVSGDGDINARNAIGQTPLMFGLQGDGPTEKHDPIELVSEVCALPGFQANLQDHRGRTALHYCAAFGCSTSAIYLLQCGADLEATDGLGNTPLSLAVKNNHEGLALMFFNKGAKPGGNITWTVDQSGKALPFVPETGETVKSGTKEGSSDDDEAEVGNRPDEEAATKSSTIFFQVVVNKWKGLAYLMVYENVPLTTAVKECYVTREDAMVTRILSKVAKERLEVLQEGSGWNLFHIVANLPGAVTQKTLDHVVQILLKTSIDPSHRDKDASTPLHLAAESGNDGVVDFLVKQERVKNVLDAVTAETKETALYIAAKHGHVRVVSSLLDAGANPDLTPPNGDSILLAAVRASQSGVTKVLLTHPKCVSQMDINRLGPDGKNCLHVAVSKNAVDICRLLLSQDSIDANAKDSDGNSAVHYVVDPVPGLGSYENVELLNLLVDNGADPNEANKAGHTPLFCSYRHSSTTMAKALVKTGKVDDDRSLKKAAKETLPEAMDEDPLVEGSVDFSSDAEELKKKLDKEADAAKDVKKVPPVDPISKLEGPCEVVECADRNGYYDVTLHQTKVEYGFHGMSMFYKIQLLRDKTKDLFILWTRYGRTGEDGQNQRTPFDSLKNAEKEFEKLFKSKSGNLWSKRVAFQKVPNKYVPLDIIEADKARQVKVKSIDTLATEEHPSGSIGCDLPLPVLNFLRAATDVKAMQESMKAGELEVDSEALPLGQLSQTSLEEGRAILQKEIEPKIKSREKLLESAEPDPDKIQKLNKELSSLTNKYYDLIPHNWGWRSVEILDNKNSFSGELSLLENLMDLEVAVRILSGAQYKARDMHPAHYAYLALDVGLHPMGKDLPYFDAICKYVGRSAPGYKVENILKVHREEDDEMFRDDLFPRKWLWHGSGLANVLGILSQGLRIAPPHAEISGAMFGKGIYTADMVSKSLGYTSPYSLKEVASSDDDPTTFSKSKTSDVTYVFLCDVALGKSSLEMEPIDIDKAKKGTQSTKGVGWRGPVDRDSIVTLDGAQIPFGPVERRQEDKTDKSKNPVLAHNEYIVYNKDQVRIRYVVELRDRN